MEVRILGLLDGIPNIRLKKLNKLIKPSVKITGGLLKSRSWYPDIQDTYTVNVTPVKSIILKCIAVQLLV
jgi:hypothetical protein